MDGATQYSVLFYVGIALMCTAVLGGIIAFAVRRRAGKRLRDRLDAEYGPKRR